MFTKLLMTEVTVSINYSYYIIIEENVSHRLHSPMNMVHSPLITLNLNERTEFCNARTLFMGPLVISLDPMSVRFGFFFFFFVSIFKCY